MTVSRSVRSNQAALISFVNATYTRKEIHLSCYWKIQSQAFLAHLAAWVDLLRFFLVVGLIINLTIGMTIGGAEFRGREMAVNFFG